MVAKVFLVCALALTPGFTTNTFLQEFYQFRAFLRQTNPGYEFLFSPSIAHPPSGPRWEKMPFRWRGYDAYKRSALALPSVEFATGPKHEKIEIEKLIKVPYDESEWSKVRDYALRLARSKDWSQEAEDIAQDTVLGLMNAIKRDVDIKDLHSYIAGIVARTIITRNQRRRPSVAISSTFDVAAHDKTADLRIYEDQMASLGPAAIEYALQAINPRLAEVIRLYLEGFDREQIMWHLGLTANQYRNNFSRGQMQLIAKARKYLKRAA